MNRRGFIKSSVAAAGVASVGASVAARATWLWAQPRQYANADRIMTGVAGRLRTAYDAALACLQGNTVNVFRFPQRALTEGAVYHGVWLECAPLEGLVYSAWEPAVAMANHRVFFDLQREDGYLPCNVKAATMGAGQIQMVVPIAATALEMYQQTHDAEFLAAAYKACARWDDWLVRYRNTRGTGLCEGFCTYDTGHDNSPRWKGVPNQCPEADARLAPKGVGVPRLCPDLSATVCGGRLALANMARVMGKSGEAAQWDEKAQAIRKLMLTRLYDPADACFYDVDTDDKFVRVRGDLLTRVLGEHVVEQPMFETIWQRQIHNPKAFWAPYPLPSIALDDPAFVRPIPRNSWGGATQALTALRAPRWMEHYGKPAEMAQMMKQWMGAMLSVPGYFAQQLDPLTGEFTTKDGGGYSPAALVLLDYTWRLHGVREQGDELEWNCRAAEGAGASGFTMNTTAGPAQLRWHAGTSELWLRGQRLASLRGTARVVTDKQGRLLRIVGTELEPSVCQLLPAHGKVIAIKLEPNAVVALDA